MNIFVVIVKKNMYNNASVYVSPVHSSLPFLATQRNYFRFFFRVQFSCELVSSLYSVKFTN